MNWADYAIMARDYGVRAAHYAPRLGLRYGRQIRRGFGGVPLARENQLLGVHKSGAAAVGAASALIGEPAQKKPRVTPPEKTIIAKPRSKASVEYSDLDASVQNLPQHPQAMSKRSATDGEEVPVVPPPKKISKIHPDYFTVSLPYMNRFHTSDEAFFTWDVDRPLLRIRLNSIYDPMMGNLTGDVATRPMLGLATDRGNIQPQGRDIWHTHFKYYRVLKTHVKLTFVTNRPQSNYNNPWNEHYAVGYELVDEDAAISDNVDMFLMTKHAKRAILKPPNTVFGDSGNSRHPENSNSLCMTYVYDPNYWQHHVEETGTEERWTPINDNPAIDHEMCVRFLHLQRGAPAGATGSVGVLVQMTYEVQFREANDSFFKTLDDTLTGYGEPGHPINDD